MPYKPYLPYIPCIPNMPCQTNHTHHTYPTYHTTPSPHHKGGRGTVPHPDHTTWGDSTMADPWPWPGGRGVGTLDHIYDKHIYMINIYIHTYAIYIYIWYIHLCIYICACGICIYIYIYLFIYIFLIMYVKLPNRSFLFTLLLGTVTRFFLGFLTDRQQEIDWKNTCELELYHTFMTGVMVHYGPKCCTSWEGT